MLSERSRGYALGADDYLVKPVDRNRLVEILERYRTPSSDAPILVVEDDEPTRALMRRVLHRDGWEVAEASNGAEALDLLEEVAPRLVLLDLMMPEVDGFEFLMRFREREECRDVPVVVVTARELDREERTQLEAGVSEILGKGGSERDALLEDVRAAIRELAGSPPGAAESRA
jgi:hypothetical protein